MIHKYIQVHTNTKSIVLALGLLLRAAGQEHEVGEGMEPAVDVFYCKPL